MLEARKENRRYSITKERVQSYINDGYDIVDTETGETVAFGAGKVVPYAQYMELKKKYEELLWQYERLEDHSAEVAKPKKSGRKKAAEK